MADDDREVPFALIIRLVTDFPHRVRAEVDVPVLTRRIGRSSVPTRQPAISFDFLDSLPDGTVTFVFTDVEGSTRLWEEARESMLEALSQHDELISDVVDTHGGLVVKPRGE